jgi:hypothetical protein
MGSRLTEDLDDKEQVMSTSSDVIRGMYIEKARQASALLAEIISGTEVGDVMANVEPYREKLQEAHRSLMEIQYALRKYP